MQWVASRAFLFDRIEPYSADVARRTQELVYNSPVSPGEKPYLLVTPFHLLLLYFPLALIADPLLARAVFMSVLELALIVLAYFSLRIAGWNAPLGLTVLFIVFGAANLYAFQALVEATPVILLGLLYAGILLSLRAETDMLTGGLIGLSLYHAEVGGLFIFLIILRAFQQRRTGVFVGLFMASSILLAISFLLYPDWIIPFLRATVNDSRSDYGFSIHGLFIRFWPEHGEFAAWILIPAMLLLLVYEISTARSRNIQRDHWVACLTLAATPLVGFRTELGSLVVLVLPMALVLSMFYTRWRRWGNALSILFLLAVILVPWLTDHFAVERYARSAQEFAFWFLPILTIAGLYWIRWWAFNPPRTWIDHLSDSQPTS